MTFIKEYNYEDRLIAKRVGRQIFAQVSIYQNCNESEVKIQLDICWSLFGLQYKLVIIPACERPIKHMVPETNLAWKLFPFASMYFL